MAHLRVVPVELSLANAFVSGVHRHHDPCTGHRWSIGIMAGARLAGVAIIGRPVAPKGYDPRIIVEVLRCCTDGTPNVCSALYGAAARTAQAAGYFAILTYTLEPENGASLRASGWWPEPAVAYTSRHAPFASSSRHRDAQYLGPKTRWVRLLSEWPEHLPSAPEEPASAQNLLFP